MAEMREKTAEEKKISEQDPVEKSSDKGFPEKEDASVQNGDSGLNEDSSDKESDDEVKNDASSDSKDEEITALKDLMMRRQADFENYKKRCIKQEETNKRMLIRDIALDIIGINDNLIRASEHALEIDDSEKLESAHKSYVDGVMMISKSIETMLQKYGIEEIDSLNKPFDPNVHEAIDISCGDDVKEDTVTKVYQKGFKFDEFVLRSSKVQVTKPELVAENKCDEENNGDKPDCK